MDRYTFRNAYYNPKFDLISQTSQFNRRGTWLSQEAYFQNF